MGKGQDESDGLDQNAVDGLEAANASDNKGKEANREVTKAKETASKRIDDIKSEMTEGEKDTTTYGVAVVKNSSGANEVWVSQAGKTGYVRPDIRKDDIVVKNKRTDATRENRYNDAEQTLIREANEKNVEILALGATRDVCPACQDAIKDAGLTDRVVTPFKKQSIT